MKLFTIYDRKTERFANPSYAVNSASYLRDVQSTLANPPQQPNPFFDHPEDFDLYEIASFDPEKGVVIPLDRPNHLGTAADYVPRTAASTV